MMGIGAGLICPRAHHLHVCLPACPLVSPQIGADVIELGVPYSDPLADGPTIQAAATRALQKGTTLDKVGEGRQGARQAGR